MPHYQEFFENAPGIRENLKSKLSTLEKGEQVWMQYSEATRAFPTNRPSEYTFEHPAADYDQLQDFAEAVACRVELLQQQDSDGRSRLPKILFTKL